MNPDLETMNSKAE